MLKHVTRSSSTVALSTLNATMVSVCFLSHRLSSRLINISDQSSGVPSLLQTHIRQHNKTTHWHKGQKREEKNKTKHQRAGCESDASGTDMHTILQQERTSVTFANTKCTKLRWCFLFFCINEREKKIKWLLRNIEHLAAFWDQSRGKGWPSEIKRALNERWLHRRETREGNDRFPVFFDSPSHDSQHSLGIQYYAIFLACTLTR